jgi:hypothetical protein
MASSLRLVSSSRPFRRSVCALLLLFFLWDIAWHTMPLGHLHDLFAAGTSILDGSSAAPADPGCGIPGHGCALSHHHHYPAIVGSTRLPIHVASLYVSRSEVSPATQHRATPAGLIRAPPSV